MRSASVAVPVIVLVALAAGAFVVVSLLSGPSGGPPAPGTGSERQAVDGDPSGPLRGEVDASDASGDPDREVVDADVPARQAVPEDGDAELAGLVLRIIDRDTEAPCPGAEVHFGDPTAMRAKNDERGGERYHHQSQLAERHGVLIRADGEGMVRLSKRDTRLVFAARHEGMFGTSSVSAEATGEVLVRLVRDETLRLRVERAGEGVAGVPVAVFQGKSRLKGRRIWRGETGPGGEVSVAHYQLVRRSSSRGKRFAAALALPVFRGPGLGPPPGIEFDGNDPPEDPIVLELPATGSLSVVVTDREGRPLEGRLGVEINAVRDAKTLPDLVVGADHDELRAEREPGEEAVHFPFVGIGQKLRVKTFLPSDGTSWVGDEVWGPARPGDHVVVRQVMNSGVVAVTGTLIGPGGAPLQAGAKPKIQLVGESRTVARAASRALDASGRFAVTGWLRDALPPFALEVSMEGAENVTLAARVEIQGLVGGASLDVGDVQLQAVTPIATGTVLNDQGEPVSRARVYLQSFRRKSARSAELVWRSDALARGYTDESGRFELTGHKTKDRIRIKASASGHVSATSADIEPGDDVTLMVVRSGRLEGVVLLPDWVPSKALTMRVRRQGDPRSRTSKLTNRKGRASFRFTGLEPGLHDVALELRNLERPVLTLPGVRIEPGSEESEDRVREIDLRAALFLYELRPVKPDGSRLRVGTGGVFARVLGVDGGWGTAAFRWKSGKVRILHPNATLDLTVLASGRRPVRMTASPGVQDVVIPAAPRVRVLLRGMRGLVGERRVRVTLVAAETGGLPTSVRSYDQWGSGSTTLGDRSMLRSTTHTLTKDAVWLTVTHPGEYRVSVRIEPLGKGRKSVRGEFGRIDTSSVPDRGEIALPFDENVVRSMLAELAVSEQGG